MSFEPPDGILDIGNATLRVGKLEVAETSGLNQGLQNIIKNDLLITENTEYAVNHKWGLKLPTTWVAEFEVKGHSGKYIDFNFYNENSASNAQGYNLTFMDTSLTLKYDGGNNLPITGDTVDSTLSLGDAGYGVATIPTIVGAYRKVNIFFERGVISVSIDGTRYLYFKESDGFNQNLGVASRVVSATGGAFVNVFIEQDASNSKFKNLRIVNGRFISDKTSNIAFIGGNLGVGVNSPKETLDIRGNMHLTRVSNVSQIKVDSNVVTEYTGPHDRPLRKYPEVALTANSDKGYVVSGSTRFDATGNYEYYKAFDNVISTGTTTWISASSTFDGSGDPTGTSNTFPGTSYRGEYCALKLPNAIKLDNFHIFSRGDASSFAYSNPPKDLRIFGSNDGTTWTHIKQFQNLSFTGLGGLRLHVNDSNTYNEYAFFVEKITVSSGGATYCAIGELELYGHEEGDSSLDTTLKTVYNVPATTGTQLEVYYDAKDLTTMPGTVTDLAGGDQNGAVSGHSPTLDETNGIESFKFDGVDDYIESTLTNDSGAWIFSKSLWFKQTVEPTNLSCMSSIGDYSASDATFFYLHSNHILVSIYSSGAYFPVKWVVNEWTHAVVVMKGTTSSINDIELYINGKKVEAKSQFGTATTRTLPTNAQLRVGREVGSGTSYFTGSIANFRLYSKALNADQVKELYDYQKDYFLGSKSQVTLYKGHLGVGVTEPSGQLELAGDERIQEYPPRGMTHSDGTPVPGIGEGNSKNITYIEGHGEFKASASKWSIGTTGYDGQQPYNAFEDTAGRRWLMYENVGYNATTGAYEDNVYQLSASSGTPYGHWLKLEMPYKVNIRNYYMKANNTSHGAKDWQVWASNDDNNWTQIHSYVNETSANSVAGSSYNVSHDGHYKMFAIIVTRIFNASTQDRVDIFRVKYFGTPGPTTLDKGSLTLGRSLDVPRISRYDVDTETPRPEKLVVNFDTTVNSSPTDISGKGNHGAFYGTNMNYSPADKAFAFNGTDDYIKSTVQTTADLAHSVSVWIKVDTVGNNTFFSLGNPTSYERKTSSMYTTSSGFAFVFFGGDMTIPFSYSVNRWYHIVGTRDTGGTFPNTQKFYIDGVDYSGSATWTNSSSTTLDLPSSSTLYIGRLMWASADFDGLISNPKIYNVALEPSEVQKLYRLGRTGRSMVISDTAVGIGKVPEAQLDVRGSIRATGSISSNNPSFSYWKTDTQGIRATLETPSGTQKAGFFQNFTTSFGQNHENGYSDENINSMFDPDSGTFHVPERGLYQLTFNFTMVDSSSAGRADETLHVSFQILNNGSYETRLTSTNAFQSFNPALTTGPSLEEYWCLSECVLLDTGANVRVYLQNVDSDNEFSITKMNFSGFKIA